MLKITTNKSSEASELAVLKMLVKKPPDYDEMTIHLSTRSSVPEGIWKDLELKEDYIYRSFGKKYKKCTTSIEIKRICHYEDQHLEEMSRRALNSLPPVVQNKFAVKRHVIAFVLYNQLEEKFKEIKRKIIKYTRYNLQEGHCLAPSIELYFFVGGKRLFIN